MEQGNFRCEKCGKLLAKYQTIECVKMEIKCPRCNLVNKFESFKEIRILNLS